MMFRLVLLCAVLSGCAGAGATPGERSGSAEVDQDLSKFMASNGYAGVEMARLATGHFSVSGSADSVSLDLIVDTGASHTLIDTDRAARFDLMTHDRGNRATSLDGTGQRTESGRLDNVAIGSLRFDTLQVTVLDLSNVNQVLLSLGNDPVDGIIGADVLMAQKAVIDYGSLTLYFKE